MRCDVRMWHYCLTKIDSNLARNRYVIKFMHSNLSNATTITFYIHTRRSVSIPLHLSTMSSFTPPNLHNVGYVEIRIESVFLSSIVYLIFPELNQMKCFFGGITKLRNGKGNSHVHVYFERV